MFRHAVFLVVSLLSLPTTAQQISATNTPADASNDKRIPADRQSAMNMLEEVLAGTGALALPQNRLAIELEAFPTIASRSKPRARALINQMISEFAQAASQSDPAHEFSLPRLRQQRTAMTTALAQTDAELALQFLNGTLPYVQPVSPKDDGPDDSDLILELATQIAAHDPRRAMQMAQQQLQSADDLPASLISLLMEVEKSDAQAGAELFRDIVQRVKQASLVTEAQNLSFAASLLANQFAQMSENGGAPGDTLRTLAEVVATAASSPQFPEGNSYLFTDALPALNALVPGRAATLQRRVASYVHAMSPEQKMMQDFDDAQSTGDDDKVVRLIERAPEDQRTAMADRAVWKFANNGDLERTRQLADNLDPWRRNNVIQQAIHSAALAAGEKGDFASARQLAAQLTDEEDRAILLSQLALHANGVKKPRLAEEILEEATSLLLNRPAGSSAFGAQLTVAQAYLHVNAAQAVPLLERAASQLEQVLAAAVQLDGFLPDPHSFDGSELILSRGYIYQSLIQPYAVATADLATIDLAAARTLADRLPLPEARLMTELYVARGVLDDKDSAQTAKNQAPAPHVLVSHLFDRY